MHTLSHLDAHYRKSMEVRFWPKVRKTNFCWEWIAGKDSNGYGNFGVKTSVIKAHRVSWMILIGDLTKGLCLDHLCRNRSCVNPDHLEEVTLRENIFRGFASAAVVARTGMCLKGLHEMTDDNTVIVNQGRARTCRTCKRNAERVYLRKWRAKKRAEMESP